MFQAVGPQTAAVGRAACGIHEIHETIVVVAAFEACESRPAACLTLQINTRLAATYDGNVAAGCRDELLRVSVRIVHRDPRCAELAALCCAREVSRFFNP